MRALLLLLSLTLLGHAADRPNVIVFLTDDQGKTYYARTLEEHAANRVKAFGG